MLEYPLLSPQPKKNWSFLCSRSINTPKNPPPFFKTSINLWEEQNLLPPPHSPYLKTLIYFYAGMTLKQSLHSQASSFCTNSSLYQNMILLRFQLVSEYGAASVCYQTRIAMVDTDLTIFLLRREQG